jgi:8-oxo-dGTP diphosphatase
VAAGVLAERDGRVVLVCRAVDPGKGEWGLPAGYLEGDETAEQGAIRECLEETGLEVDITDLIDVYSFDTQGSRGGVLIIYAAQVVGGTLRAGDDAAEARFFGPLELPDDIAFSTHRQALADWHRAKAIRYREATLDEASVVSELNDRYRFDRSRDYAEYIRAPQSALYVAVDREKIVGLSGVRLQDWNRTACIDLIFVLPNYRRWGIATLLIERCVNFGRTLAARTVVAEVPAMNPALAMYLRAGFRVCGFNNTYYPPGTEERSTALFLAYDLDAPAA